MAESVRNLLGKSSSKKGLFTSTPPVNLAPCCKCLFLSLKNSYLPTNDANNLHYMIVAESKISNRKLSKTPLPRLYRLGQHFDRDFNKQCFE